MKKIILILIFGFLVSLTYGQNNSKPIKDTEEKESSEKVQIEKVSKISQNNAANAVVTYDFTTGSGQYYGGALGAKDLGGGVWGMIAGNGTSVDKVVDANDYGVVFSEFFQTGYKLGDYDLNGVVDANDYGTVFNNFFKASQVP